MKKKFSLIKLILLCFFTSNICHAAEAAHPAVTATIPTENLINFKNYSPATKNLLETALNLTKKNLTYTYGSADPANGGMDCSGTIYYILNQLKVNSVPRQSNEIYVWASKEGKIFPVGDKNLDAKTFANLKPGDLLFWTGTYAVKHTPPITHVMFYLGKNAEGKALMVGASDGRTFNGKKMWGVSVFDFKLQSTNANSHFIGYSCVPHLTCPINGEKSS
jgi:hypothetical protein